MKVCSHHTAEELLALSRSAKRVKDSHRCLAIRDLLLGDSRVSVMARYGVSHDTIWRWVKRYNEQGGQGLAARAAPGAETRLKEEDVADFKRRISAGPSYETDGVVRWRAQDIRTLLSREYGAEYKSLSGVRKLCHALGLSYLTTRPSHPKRDEAAAEEFKKNSLAF